jgi:hypothetical protein
MAASTHRSFKRIDASADHPERAPLVARRGRPEIFGQRVELLS